MARLTAQQREVERLLAGLEPRVAEAFRQAIEASWRNIDYAALIEALERGDIPLAMAIIQPPPAVWFVLTEAIRAAYIEGGNMVARAAPRAVLGFGGDTPEAQAWLRDLSSTRIQGIQADTLDAVRQVLVEGRRQGMSSRQIATMIVGRRVGNRREGGILGLTAQIADSIMAGRAKLASGDAALMAEYLELKLRDRRFDRTIRKAIQEGRAITGRELDNILDAHKSKALAYRGSVIAKSETFSALEAGRREAVRQALLNPEVASASKRWQHNLSREPRLHHIFLGAAPARDFNEPFVMEGGVLMQYAHDPAGGPENNANCRCITVYRIRMRT